MKKGILTSGELGFKLLDYLSKREIIFVMTDSKSTKIINYCKKKNIPFFKGNPNTIKAKEFYKTKKIDILISLNYIFLIDKNLINNQKIAFNVHGSLLPKYRGRTPHVWAIINNEDFTGVTSHIIDEGCDTGDILFQSKLKIKPNDTGGSILKKFESIYLMVIDKTIEKIKNKNLNLIKQDNSRSSFFHARKPEDGKINWDWQKERIFNWVRALSSPYPGAFTFIGNKKIIIDKVAIDDFSFDQNMKNGLILSTNPIRIKTQNGVILVKKIRNFDKANFFEGKILK